MTSKDKLDDLTGLHTRRILEELDHKFSTVAGEDIWSLVIIDIDHFKLVNDVYGHLEGDRVIRRVASILARNCRSTDTLLRYGGDEFVIVMPLTEQLEAVNQAERILQGLAQEVFPEGMEVGLSIGVAESKPKDLHLAEIFERADKALYKAKKGGRGRVSFHQDNEAEIKKAELSFDHFVGREQELSTLRNILDETITGTGKGHLALISGEPGIGKSRLAYELKHYSSFKKCLFLETRCDELGTNRPYLQLTGPIARLLLTFSKDDLNNLAETLPEILPQTAELFPCLNLNLKLASAPAADKNDVIKFRMYSEISTILRWITTRQSVIFMVDNLHWISEHDFDLFAYLVRATPDVPVFFLSTIRPLEDFPEIQKKIRILSSLVQFTSIKLDNLDEEYRRHMIMFALRDPNIPMDVLERLMRQSSGNPLYLKELLLSLHASGAIKSRAEGGWTYQISGDLPLSATIAQFMAARLEKLDSFTKEILCTGSLMPGGSFSLEPICAVLQKDELEVAKALEEPLRRELIHEKLSNSNIPEYRFIHDTMRSYLYRELTLGIRKALQSRFGLYYEGIYNKGNTDIIPLAAHHYCDSLNSDKARQFALMAKKQACDKDAKREALRWLEQYMSLTGTAKENTEEEFQARLLLGKLYIHFANLDKAAQILEDAAQFTTDNIQIGLLRFQEARLHFNTGEHCKALDFYKEAIQLLPPGAERIRIHIQIAFIQYLSVSGDTGLKLLENVLEDIQTIKDERTKTLLQATYYMMHSFIAKDSVSRTQRIEECVEAVALFRQLGERKSEIRALLNTAALLPQNKYGAIIDTLNDALKLLTQTGDVHAIMVAYVNLGCTFYDVKEYSLSRDYFQRCLELVEATGAKQFGVWANRYLGMIDTEQNNFPSAEQRFTTAIESAEALGLTPMTALSRFRFVEMLVKQKKFERADRLLSRLEHDEVLESMGNSTVKTLLGIRGRERLRNTTIDRVSALNQAEEKLRSAIAYIGDEPSLEDITLLGSLVECLHAQGKFSEGRNFLRKAQNLMQAFAAEIDNDHYRQIILNSEVPEKLNNLSKLLEDSNPHPGD